MNRALDIAATGFACCLWAASAGGWVVLVAVLLPLDHLTRRRNR